MRKLIPNECYENIYKINYEKLKKKNIKCILFDIDNTCIPYKEKKLSKELKQLFKNLNKQGFRIIIFTNAPKRRTIPFRKINIECNPSSKKPFKYNFNKIINKYKYKKEEVCIVGDQIFTDIYGGNRTGIYTILVDPLSNKDLIFTKILRALETVVRTIYKRKGLFDKGE